MISAGGAGEDATMDVSVEEKKAPVGLESFGFKKEQGPPPTEAGAGGDTLKASRGGGKGTKKAGGNDGTANGTLESFGFGTSKS